MSSTKINIFINKKYKQLDVRNAKNDKLIFSTEDYEVQDIIVQTTELY